MKIFLLNSNPVVTKLVTLSANKTNSTLESYESVDELVSTYSCDLLIVDDALYSDSTMEMVLSTVRFQEALFIHTRDVEVPEAFKYGIKKPFLPTDLVELFATVAKSVVPLEEDMLMHELEHELGSIDELGEDDLDLLEDKEDIKFDELGDLEDLDSGLDELEDLDDGLEDLGSGLEDLDGKLEDPSLETPSVLDEDELKEVQGLLGDDLDDDLDAGLDVQEELLDELLEAKELEFDEALDLEKTSGLQEEDLDAEEFSLDDIAEEIALDEELDLIDESKEDTPDLDEELGDLSDLIDKSEEDTPDQLGDLADLIDESEVEELEEDLDDLVSDDENVADELDDLVSDDVADDLDDEVLVSSELDELDDLSRRIEEAKSELSSEELDSVIDDDMLDELAMLSSSEIKDALGEAVDDEPQESTMLGEMQEDREDELDAPQESASEDPASSLKKLLLALEDEGVKALLKDQKISINITIG